MFPFEIPSFLDRTGKSMSPEEWRLFFAELQRLQSPVEDRPLTAEEADRAEADRWRG